jgi:hypothetical protein
MHLVNCIWPMHSDLLFCPCNLTSCSLKICTCLCVLCVSIQTDTTDSQTPTDNLGTENQDPNRSNSQIPLYEPFCSLSVGRGGPRNTRTGLSRPSPLVVLDWQAQGHPHSMEFSKTNCAKCKNRQFYVCCKLCEFSLAFFYAACTHHPPPLANTPLYKHSPLHSPFCSPLQTHKLQASSSRTGTLQTSCYQLSLFDVCVKTATQI